MPTPQIPSAVLVAVYLGLFLVAVVLTAIDAREHRLPNRIVFPLTAGVIVLCTCDALWRGDTSALSRALLGGASMMAGYFLLYRKPAGTQAGATSARGMGGGDVKLALPLGMVLAWHGWAPLLVGTLSAFLIAGVAVFTAIAFGRAQRSTLIAFGPFMLLGGVIGVASAHQTVAAVIVGL